MILKYLIIYCRMIPKSPVLQHLVQRILPTNLVNPINILVIPYIKDRLER